MRKKRFLVTRGSRRYIRHFGGTKMFDPNVRKLAKKFKLRPDKQLLKTQRSGTFRRGNLYVKLKGPGGKPVVRHRVKGTIRSVVKARKFAEWLK